MTQGGDSMIDRQARDKVLQILSSYMEGSTTMNDIDLQVFELDQETNDELIAFAGSTIWRCTEHGGQKTFEGNREVWNLLCRLKLLLASNVEAKVRTAKRCHPIQPVALFSLFVLFPLLICIGSLQIGIFFWLYMFLCGLWTWYLEVRHNRILERFHREEIRPHLEPFNSFAELLAIRRSVPDFRKLPYPAGVPERSIDQEEPLGYFSRFCESVFFVFLHFVLWFGLLFQLVFRDERIQYEFTLRNGK